MLLFGICYWIPGMVKICGMSYSPSKEILKEDDATLYFHVLSWLIYIFVTLCILYVVFSILRFIALHRHGLFSAISRNLVQYIAGTDRYIRINKCDYEHSDNESKVLAFVDKVQRN